MKMKMKKTLILLLCLLLICPPQRAAAAARQGRDGDTLRMTIYHPATLNPLKTTDEDAAQLLMVIFSPLMDTLSDGTPTENGIVRSFHLSEDGRTLTLWIREDARFGDGSPVCVEDAAFSLRALSAGSNYWQSGLKNLDSVQLIRQDETGAYVIYDPAEEETSAPEEDASETSAEEGKNPDQQNHPENRQPQKAVLLHFSSVIDEKHLGFLCIPVLPEHVYRENAPEWIPIGSGPFRVASYETMNRIMLEKNPYYPDECALSAIRVDITRTEEACSSAFQQKLTDLIYEREPEKLSAMFMNHSQVCMIDTHVLRYIRLNQTPGSFFTSRRARQALMVLLDREELLNKTAMGMGVCAASLVPDWICSCTPDDAYAYDENRIDRLLGDSPEGCVTILLAEGDLLSVNQAVMLQKELQRTGVAAALEIVPAASYESAWESGQYDLSFAQADLETQEDLQRILSENRAAMEEESAEKMDNLYRTAVEAEELAEREKARQQLSQLLWENLPIAPLYYQSQAVLLSEQLSGKLEGTPYQVYRGIEKMTFRGE